MKAVIESVIVEVVYTYGKETLRRRKTFLVKNYETLQALIFFVTNSRYSIISVSFLEDCSYALADGYSIPLEK